MNSQFQRSLREADGLGRDSWSGAIERGHRVAEALSLFSAEEVLHGHAAVLELQFDDGNAADPHLVLDLSDREARGRLLDDDGRDAARPLRRGVGATEDRVDRGDTAIGVPFLVPVEDVRVTVAARGALETPGVAPRIALREAKGDQGLALRDRRKPPALLLLRAAQDDRERTEGVDRIGDADPAAGPRQLLDHDAEIQEPRAVPTILLGHPDAGQIGGLQRFQDLPRIFLELVVFGGDRAYRLFRDLARARAVGAILVGQQVVEGGQKRFHRFLHGKESSGQNPALSLECSGPDSTRDRALSEAERSNPGRGSGLQ